MNPIIDPISKAVVPNTLYKYRACDSIGFILLENQELYISSPNFNDPFDCNIPVKIELLVSNRTQFDEFANQYENYSQLPEVLKEEVWKGMRDKDVQAEYVQFQTKQFKEIFGVYCLSGDAENLLMWSHYGGSHSGFCLGMDMNVLIRLQKFTTIGPVYYTNIYPHIAPQKYDVEDVYKQLFYKSLDWSYEKEYRVILKGGAAKKIQFPAELISEILLGASITPENRDMIINLRNKKYPKAKVIQLNLSESEFKLIRTQL